ncbi:ATP-binding protein [Vibrio sp. CJQ_6]|uniref:ATP-binding protein n=1 Tax=Vibrio sp. CJQ_6 TaxID=3367165 RepID=UPI003709CBFD
MKFWLHLIVLLCPLFSNASSLFTEGEEQWMKAHPVILYTFPESWPVDYIEDGEHKGLTKDYLNAISNITGLTFRQAKIDTEGKTQATVDLISAVSQRFHSNEGGWQLTTPFLSVSAIVITQASQSSVYTLKQLVGRKIGILKGSFYEKWISEHYPEIVLEPFDNGLLALRALNRGEIYAAIGTELTMRPLMQQYFPTSLSIAGVLSETYTGISMAVVGSIPTLVDILNKALASLTAKQTDEIFEHWVGSLNLGQPPIASIFFYYRYEIIFFVVLVMGLSFSLHQARQARLSAEKSEKDKARFLAIMSHEIRTPLNAVMASLELLQREDSKIRESNYLEMASNSAQSLMELLNDILDFSRLESDNMTIHNVSVELKPLLESVCDSHRASAINKGIILQLEDKVPCDDLVVSIDPQRVRQILHNIISNAIKFSIKGNIVVSVTAERVAVNSLRLHITVIDEGPGIERRVQTRLFEAWEQGGSNQQGQKGSGLGLYISHQLARRMGGELSLQSELGVGTRVTLTLPFDVTQHQESADKNTAQMLACFDENISVLVVEDHDMNRQLIALQLQELGCHVDVVGGGIDAVQRIQDECYYSLILLDCNLPDISGYEVSERIRRFEESQGTFTPIIAISAMSEDEHVNRCYESGMSDVLYKPIRLDSLSKILTKWCGEDFSCDHALQEAMSPELDTDNYLERDLVALKIAFENQDAVHQLYYAHRIRGAGLMCGNDALSDLASELESLLRRGEVVSEFDGLQWCKKMSECNVPKR